MQEDIVVQADALRWEKERSASLERSLEACEKEVSQLRDKIAMFECALEQERKSKEGICKVAYERECELKDVLRSIALFANVALRDK